MEGFCSCFIFFGNGQQCISISPELVRETTKDNCESNALALHEMIVSQQLVELLHRLISKPSVGDFQDHGPLTSTPTDRWHLGRSSRLEADHQTLASRYVLAAWL